jgi:ATP-binding cassette subfamily C protein CydC
MARRIGGDDMSPSRDRPVVRRILALTASHRRWVLAGAILGFLAVGANVALMGMSAYLISRAAIATNVADVALAVTAVRVLAIARATFRYLERYATHRASLRILADLRRWFYAAIEPLAPAGLGGRRPGDLLTRIVTDIETLDDFYVRVVVPPLAALLVIAVAGLAFGALDPLAGIVLAGFLVVTGAGLPIATRRLAREPATALVDARGALGAAVVDDLDGLAELVALDQADAHRLRVLGAGDAVDRARTRLAGVRGLGLGVAALLTTLCAVAVLEVGIVAVGAGRLDGVLLATIPLAAIAAFETVTPLAASVQVLDTSRAAAARLFELTDAPPPVREPETPAAPPGPGGHGIAIRGLRFAYEDGDGPVLDGLDLTVPDGSRVALIGPSGAGKSTLVDLLLRFWEVDAGMIEIGGRDIRDYAVDDVRAMFGVVAQEVDLFDATIRDNLAVADAAVSDEAIEAACRVAQLHDRIAALPDGYDTRIGEDGTRLSGGERRRLAIARAILRDAPILVLDEATSDLDPATEAKLVTALRPFMAGRTTLLLSHRTALVGAADAVVRLDGGRAVTVASAAAGGSA